MNEPSKGQPRQLRPQAQGLYDPANEKDGCGVGFIAQIKGVRSHSIVTDADQMLRNMDHRGACGCEPNTGDGAGILTALPHEFLQRVAKEELGATLPEPGRFAAGIVFLPSDPEENQHCRDHVEELLEDHSLDLVGWRDVPVEPEIADLGPTARAAMPVIVQLFVSAPEGLESDAFERRLYLVRKQASHHLRTISRMTQAEMFYICSLSTKVLIYKGMLSPDQLVPFFPDLAAEDFTSHLAMVHSRFSTNTFPSWDRAQPNRFMSHNGEINTLRGNSNWMHAREGVVKSELFGRQLQKAFPIIEPDCSDSGNFDNALEFLLMTGRTLQEAIMMMIPEAWQNDAAMEKKKRAFYEYHSCLMEPWDGPASIAFTDGKYIGAVLDRNGLRPSRYYVTTDDRVIMASEVGVLEVDPKTVLEKGRLEPGRMFLVDFEQGRIVDDEELKAEFTNRRPYDQWLEEQRIEIDELPRPSDIPQRQPYLLDRMQAFGYTAESVRFMLRPLVTEQRDPVGSMGNDAALAVLSDQPRLIYDYFKQLFAQVTNPAIDSIREEVVMSLETFIGPESNLLETTAEHAHRLRVPHPILTNEETAALKHLDYRGWKSRTIDITWDREEGEAGMLAALDRICKQAEQAIDDGYQIVVLSDRRTAIDRVPVSSLLACGAVHQHLLRHIKRTRIGIVLETGEAREVHHHCLLIGFGADAINPYLALEALVHDFDSDRLGIAVEDTDAVVKRYRKGVAKGMLKVMAKMGISTLQSYKGAQIFEAVGLGPDIMRRCFAGTASRLAGVGFDTLAAEAMRRHAIGYPKHQESKATVLPNPGEYHWRASGESHMWSPHVIASLQNAARNDSRQDYERFARLSNELSTRRCTLRGLLTFREGLREPVPIEEVEPATEIVKRFCTGAMSFGSISAESHESLAIAMNRMGGKSNTGEGGEDSERFKVMENGDSKRSAIKQVASGRFGVTAWYLTNADELQIKIAQGAKPGEGGELPGHKVDEVIARTRHSTPGVGLISPPPHHDIYSIEDLKQLIHDLKNANPSARISVKLVSEIGVGTIAAGVAKGFADHILISGHDGGTGASPLTSIKHAGLPWELGLAETHQTLVLNDLRSRVVLQTDGQLKTGRDVVMAALLGAEEFGFATAPLVTLGCIMMRKCHLNTCPVGIATQDPELRRRFAGKPEYVVNYLFMVAEDARNIMATLGYRTINEMVGQVQALETDQAIHHWKSDGLDLTPILTPATRKDAQTGLYCTRSQDHGLESALDHQLIELAKPALERGESVAIDLPILNIHRAVGTTLSHEVMKAHGEHGLPEGTIAIKLSGSAGQSVGAFLARGVAIEVVGDANDHVGKGLSGGRIVVSPPPESIFVPEDNILIGNVALYGATSGEAYFHGRAAERFAVRNSGARAVVEGVGDHGCEYMTGGRVVVLGETGPNFAAGMSGGIAWVLDPDRRLAANCNMEMVELEALEDEERIAELHELLQRHLHFTGSKQAAALLENWPAAVEDFVQVMPTDFKRALEQRSNQRSAA